MFRRLSLGDLCKADGLIIVFFPDDYRFSGIFIDHNRLIISSNGQPVGEFPRVALDAGLVFEDLLLNENRVPRGKFCQENRDLEVI